MNDPTHEYYKPYEIDYDRHTYDGENWTYINLPAEDIKKMAIESIKDNAMMYFSCDVNKFFDRERGVLDTDNFDYSSLMGVDFGSGDLIALRSAGAYGESMASTYNMRKLPGSLFIG